MSRREREMSDYDLSPVGLYEATGIKNYNMSF